VAAGRERPEWGDAPGPELFPPSARRRSWPRLVRPFVGGAIPFYELGKERWERWAFSAACAKARAVGWIDLFDEDWAFGVNVLERFRPVPLKALATLPRRGGFPLALERAGRHPAAPG